jgi:hypothetical protein
MSSAGRKMTLGEYVDKFIEEHAIAEADGQVILDVTSQEAEDLGFFFIRGICGFMQGINQVRFLRRLPRTIDEAGDDDLIEGEEDEEIKEFVN